MGSLRLTPCRSELSQAFCSSPRVWPAISLRAVRRDWTRWSHFAICRGSVVVGQVETVDSAVIEAGDLQIRIVGAGSLDFDREIIPEMSSRFARIEMYRGHRNACKQVGL